MKKIISWLWCPICEGILGTHFGLIHQIEMYNELKKIQEKAPWLASVRVNMKLFMNEYDKWN